VGVAKNLTLAVSWSPPGSSGIALITPGSTFDLFREEIFVHFRDTSSPEAGALKSRLVILDDKENSPDLVES
jgi:hypothetical protein